MSDIKRIYYWSNLILNPLLLLLLLIPDARETIACTTVIWTMLSGLINPRVRAFMATILASGVESLIATISASCYVIFFGGVLAVLLISAAIVLAGLIYVVLLFAALIFLWIDALNAIRASKASYESMNITEESV
jgi:hypothetical protein